MKTYEWPEERKLSKGLEYLGLRYVRNDRKDSQGEL